MLPEENVCQRTGSGARLRPGHGRQESVGIGYTPNLGQINDLEVKSLISLNYAYFEQGRPVEFPYTLDRKINLN